MLAQTNRLYRPAFPPVRHGSRDSSVKQCRQSDCSNNVPPHCPIGFKRTHCTNGRAQFVPTSIALCPPILYVWSEKVRDIKSTIRTKKMQSCNQFIQNKLKSLARCTVSLPIPWDPNGCGTRLQLTTNVKPCPCYRLVNGT